jgi:hypothetical protein
MAEIQWARLQADVQCGLRRGAWYRVLRLGAREAILDVHRTPRPVDRALLEFSPTPPTRWSVVLDPRSQAALPDFPTEYAVCPNCRTRATMMGQPSILRCPRCNGLFEVVWEEPDPAGGRGPRAHDAAPHLGRRREPGPSAR